MRIKVVGISKQIPVTVRVGAAYRMEQMGKAITRRIESINHQLREAL